MWLDGIYFTFKIEGLRALDVTVVTLVDGAPVPIEGAKVAFGHLVGVDPTTGQETYFWLDGDAKITDLDGRVVFSGLEPDWYGLRVTAQNFKEAFVPNIDLTATDKAITVELEPVTIGDFLPLLVGGIIVIAGFIVIVQRL